MKRTVLALIVLTSALIAAPDDDRVAARRTALDLAGSGQANAASLKAAFKLALALATQRDAPTHSS